MRYYLARLWRWWRYRSLGGYDAALARLTSDPAYQEAFRNACIDVLGEDPNDWGTDWESDWYPPVLNYELIEEQEQHESDDHANS